MKNFDPAGTHELHPSFKDVLDTQYAKYYFVEINGDCDEMYLFPH